MAEQYEIIGTRSGSMFRVPGNYFHMKRRFRVGMDPTTGGPVAIVEPGTDTVVPGLGFDDEGNIVPAPAGRVSVP